MFKATVGLAASAPMARPLPASLGCSGNTHSPHTQALLML